MSTFVQTSPSVSPLRPSLPMAGALALLVGGALAPAASAEAQTATLSWTQVSQVEVPGTMGAVLRATGVLGERRSEHAMHLQGRTLRQDDGASSVIFDAEGRRFITLDHEAGTYMEVTFEESAQLAREMTEVMLEAREGAEEALREAQAERDEMMEELRRNMDAMEESFRFEIRTERTGERRAFGAYSAERHLLSGSLELQEGIEGVEDGEGGTLLFLVELWQSADFPDMDAFMEEWARALAEDPAMQAVAADMAEAFEPVTGGSQAELLALWDPRIAAGVSRMVEAMESLEGTTMASRTLVAAVEDGATLDQAELLAWEPASMGDQLRAGAGDAAREAAQDAARGALRGLSRGLLGRGGGEEAEEVREPRVHPLLSYRSARENPLYETGTAGGENPLFQELSTYRPISLQELINEARPTGR